MGMKQVYERSDGTLSHYGKKGMKWGVRNEQKYYNQASRTGEKSKPSSSQGAKSPSRVAAQNKEAMRAEAEFLRSIGRSDLAEKLELEFLGGPVAALAKEGEAEAAEGEGEGEGEEEEGKGKGKAAAAAAPKAKEEEDDEDDAEEAEAEKKAAERAKWQSLAKTQQEVARSFQEAAIDASQEVAKLTASTAALTNRLPGFRKDLATAQENGDGSAEATLTALITKLQGRIAANAAASEAHQSSVLKLTSKSDEWTAKADESLANISADDDDEKKVEQGVTIDLVNDIVHYGVKGMKWGVRRTPEQRARAATKEARTLSDAKLKAKTERLNLEKRYVDLVRQDAERNQSTISRGEAALTKILIDSGSSAVRNVTTGIFTAALATHLQRQGVPYVNIKKKKK